jgi:hypothetical protein
VTRTIYVRSCLSCSLRIRREPESTNEGVPVTTLIPFVREICPVVSVSEGRLEIAPPDGLLDLVTVGATTATRGGRVKVDGKPRRGGKTRAKRAKEKREKKDNNNNKETNPQT